MVTASHNPPDYNGMKFVREGSRPISGDNGLQDIRQDRGVRQVFTRHGTRVGERFRRGHHARVHRPPAVVRRSRQAQAAQGRRARRQRRGRADRRQAPAVPAVRVHQGTPRAGRHVSRTACRTRCWSRTTAAPVEALRKHRADCAISWDGDFDRCFLCSTSTAASSRATTSWACWPRCSCSVNPGSRIVHDPRLTWNTLDIVAAHGHGEAVQSKSGPRVHQGR